MWRLFADSGPVIAQCFGIVEASARSGFENVLKNLSKVRHP